MVRPDPLQQMQSFFLVVGLAHFVFGKPNQEWRDSNELTSNGLLPSCESQIYCESEFLHDVQLSGVTNDSKSLVDMRLLYAGSEILSKYKTLKNSYDGLVPPNTELIKFIFDNLAGGDELEEWYPKDFLEAPPIFNRTAAQFHGWIELLNRSWCTLARKVKDDVRTRPDMYSMIWVPNGFIIPGGRFKELYYWDSYWIIKGLLLCDMRETAKGIIGNILYLVQKFGFVPNGGRIYYVTRSQPPMLIQMASVYCNFTDDFEFIRNEISTLEKEFQFWMNNRMITFQKDGKSYTMARYYGPSRGPRPESYREDYNVAEQYDTEEKKNDFYVRIKSAAETGWDFSSRWLITANGSDRGTLSDVQAQCIVPVDLNSMLQSNALILSEWFDKLDENEKARKYKSIADTFVSNIHEVMWRADKGAWFDWDLINNKHRESFYVSNIVPLWTRSHNIPNDVVASAVLRYLRDMNVVKADFSSSFNGTPASMYESSQQWDFPNGWPPLQAFIIQGLYNTRQKFAKRVAANLALAWLSSNQKGHDVRGIMFEKYDVTMFGMSGHGGEYTPQTGFGWSNGVALELLTQWDELVADSKYEPPPDNNSTRKRRESKRMSRNDSRLGTDVKTAIIM